MIKNGATMIMMESNDKHVHGKHDGKRWTTCLSYVITWQKELFSKLITSNWDDLLSIRKNRL
jgi:hypothetical protein